MPSRVYAIPRHIWNIVGL